MKGKRFKRATALLSTAAMLLTYADLSAINFSVHAEENDDEPKLTDFDVNGNGIIEEGEKDWGYALDSADDLYWFADKVNNDNANYGSANAFLACDITVNSDVLNENGGLNEGDFKAWTPVGAYNEIKEEYYYYSGTFDGNNKTISGLYFNNDSQRYVGLFGYVGTGGKIQDVTIADSYMYGKTKVGGICGNNNGTISNCYNTGDVTGTENYVGGVCGNNTGTILICYNTGDVTGTEKYVGGVCGSNTGGSISNCYNTGDVTGTGNYVGGVCGRNTGGSISNCYNTGDVTGTGNDVGGVCGNNLQSEISNCYNTGDVTGTGNNVGGVCGSNPGTITNCYYLDTIAENGIGNVDDETGSAEAKSAEQFASGEVCWLLNGGETQAETPAFYQTLGEDAFPVLDSTDNMVYKNKACDGVSDYYNHENKDQEHSYENGFCTICDGYQPATTVKDVNDIDGDGHTDDDVYEISNAGQLYWFADKVNNEHYGSANAVLTKNITVNSGVLDEDGELNSDTSDFRVWTPIGYYDYVNKKSYSYYGAFDGAGHTISGLYFNGSSANNVGLFGYVGTGGKIQDVTIADSYFCGKEKVGGVCGYSYCATIQKCSNTGKVTGTENVGGVCGYVYKRTIENCYNTGKVSGNSCIGGICGYNDEKNTIQNCYNTGAVSGDTIVGGICGKVNYTSLSSNAYKMVINCYNTGKVTGNTYVGSINGSGESKLIENCYYLGTEGVSGRGGGPDYAGSTEVKSAEQFASGEVCYLLNGGETQAETPVFFQNLEDKKDDLPVLDSKHSRVYLTTNCVVYSNTYIGMKNHSPESQKKDATCTEDGHSEYWYCKDCGKYFSDAGCTAVIDNIETWMSENAIPATGHSYKDGICEKCGAFEDGIGARLAGVSLSLDGSIGVNFYMELSENVIADENAYLLVTYPNGSDDKMAVSDVKPINMNGKKYYIFQCKVAATEMTDTITAQMMTSNGDGTKYSYSVKEYADYLLAHTDDNEEYKKAEELVKAMLNYGAYAQIFKEHNTDNLPCEPMDITGYNVKEHSFTAASSDNVKFKGANLSMLSNTTLRLFFVIVDKTGVTISYGSEKLEIGENNGLYYVEIKNITPQNLDNDFTVEVNDNGKTFSVSYSPLAYCYQVSKSSDDDAFVNLVKAIALYNDIANFYFREEM
ncbi:MAG: hypothetical protein MJ100_08820 [Ruminococcus sp.]|nr:hypothetical protein [Ruminococcus sp.]